MPGPVPWAPAGREFRGFLYGRAWTHAEGPVALFNQAVGWLRRHRVLLSGVSVLAKQVAAVRAVAEKRLYATVANATRRADGALPGDLVALLQAPEGRWVSELERLRQPPTRTTGTSMAKALERVEEISSFRQATLARVGLGSKAPRPRASPSSPTASRPPRRSTAARARSSAASLRSKHWACLAAAAEAAGNLASLDAVIAQTPVRRGGTPEDIAAAVVFLASDQSAFINGVGLPVETPTGNMVIDIGGGTTNIAIIASGGVVSSVSLPAAGNAMDESIRDYVRSNYCLQIGEYTAEALELSRRLAG